MHNQEQQLVHFESSILPLFLQRTKNIGIAAFSFQYEGSWEQSGFVCWDVGLIFESSEKVFFLEKNVFLVKSNKNTAPPEKNDLINSFIYLFIYLFTVHSFFILMTSLVLFWISRMGPSFCVQLFKNCVLKGGEGGRAVCILRLALLPIWWSFFLSGWFLP